MKTTQFPDIRYGYSAARSWPGPRERDELRDAQEGYVASVKALTAVSQDRNKMAARARRFEGLLQLTCIVAALAIVLAIVGWLT